MELMIKSADDSANEGLMIIVPLTSVALLWAAALHPGATPTSPLDVPALAARHKEAHLVPLVRAATECIVTSVTADPRYDDTMRPDELTSLIDEAMDSCAEPVRAMIDGHDELYGQGSGEAFFLGPYLNAVPSAVGTQVRAPAD